MSEIVGMSNKKRSRKWLWVIVGTLCLLVLLILGLSVYVGWNLTHPEREAINDNPANYGLNYKEVEFKSADEHIDLKGWFISPESYNGMTIVIAHGYRKNRIQDDVPALKLVRQLTDRGYQTFMFDFRNSGQSGGDLTSVGQFEKYDLLGAVQWLKQNTTGKIGVIGFSMGGATAMLAAAEDTAIAGLVSDSSFHNLDEYLRENLSVWSGLPEFPFTSLIMTLIPPVTGTDPHEVNPLRAVEKIYPRPILFIHGKADQSIPYSSSQRLAETHPDRFSLWLTDDADHVGSYQKGPEQYAAKVDEFFRKLL